MDMLTNLLARHYELERGYASHFEAVSARRRTLQQHGEVHTPLFEACFRIVVKIIRQANLNGLNTRGTSGKSKCQTIHIHIEERIIKNQFGGSAGKLLDTCTLLLYVTGI